MIRIIQFPSQLSFFYHWVGTMIGGTAVKKKLNFRFHDPNPTGVAAEYILKELVAANLPKVERAVREAKRTIFSRSERYNRSDIGCCVSHISAH